MHAYKRPARRADVKWEVTERDGEFFGNGFSVLRADDTPRYGLRLVVIAIIICAREKTTARSAQHKYIPNSQQTHTHTQWTTTTTTTEATHAFVCAGQTPTERLSMLISNVQLSFGPMMANKRLVFALVIRIVCVVQPQIICFHQWTIW